MLKIESSLDENCNIICLGDLNINFMANIPTNIRDIIFINGFVNIRDFNNGRHPAICRRFKRVKSPVRLLETKIFVH